MCSLFEYTFAQIPSEFLKHTDQKSMVALKRCSKLFGPIINAKYERVSSHSDYNMVISEHYMEMQFRFKEYNINALRALNGAYKIGNRTLIRYLKQHGAFCNANTLIYAVGSTELIDEVENEAITDAFPGDLYDFDIYDEAIKEEDMDTIKYLVNKFPMRPSYIRLLTDNIPFIKRICTILGGGKRCFDFMYPLVNAAEKHDIDAFKEIYAIYTSVYPGEWNEYRTNISEEHIIYRGFKNCSIKFAEQLANVLNIWPGQCVEQAILQENVELYKHFMKQDIPNVDGYIISGAIKAGNLELLEETFNRVRIKDDYEPMKYFLGKIVKNNKAVWEFVANNMIDDYDRMIGIFYESGNDVALEIFIKKVKKIKRISSMPSIKKNSKCVTLMINAIGYKSFMLYDVINDYELLSWVLRDYIDECNLGKMFHKICENKNAVEKLKLIWTYFTGISTLLPHSLRDTKVSFIEIALFLAASCGQVATVKYLISLGAKEIQLAFEYACLDANINVVRYLLDFRAEDIIDMRTGLILACCNINGFGVIRYLTPYVRTCTEAYYMRLYTSLTNYLDNNFVIMMLREGLICEDKELLNIIKENETIKMRYYFEKLKYKPICHRSILGIQYRNLY